MNKPETAPRDGTPIIADFGWPWFVIAVFDPGSRCWRVAYAAIDDSEGPPNHCIETDSEDDGDLRGWVPMPRLKRLK